MERIKKGEGEKEAQQKKKNKVLNSEILDSTICKCRREVFTASYMLYKVQFLFSDILDFFFLSVLLLLIFVALDS